MNGEIKGGSFAIKPAFRFGSPVFCFTVRKSWGKLKIYLWFREDWLICSLETKHLAFMLGDCFIEIVHEVSYLIASFS